MDPLKDPQLSETPSAHPVKDALPSPPTSSSAGNRNWYDHASSLLPTSPLAIGLTTAAAITVGAPVVVAAAGFSSAGVVAGSLAAAWQSSIGSVAAGSAFATLQSLTSTGAIYGASVAAGTGAGGAAAGLRGTWQWWTGSKSERVVRLGAVVVKAEELIGNTGAGRKELEETVRELEEVLGSFVEGENAELTTRGWKAVADLRKRLSSS